MASLTAGTTFTDGVANDVTAAKLGALVTNATPTSGFIQDRTAETVVAVNDTLLIGDASDSNNLKRMTVANLLKAPLVSTSGTIDVLTTGTTTSTAEIVTSGTIATLNSTTGTIATLNSTTGTIATLNSTTGTITNLSATTSTFLGTITGSTNVINIGSGQIYKDSSGNVGIGQSSPPSNGHLTINRTGTETNIQLQEGGVNTAQISSYQSDMYLTVAGSKDIILRPSGSEAMRIKASGNVGVGTASPVAKLSIKVADASLTDGITLVNDTASGGDATGVVISASLGAAGSKYESSSIRMTQPGGFGGTIFFATNDDNAGSAIDRMTILKSGNVGIATTAPVNKLEIVGSFGRGAPVTKTADFTLADTENWIIVNKAASTCTVTLPAASSWTGREFTIKTLQAFTVVSATASSVVPRNSATAGTAILAAAAGNWATLVSNGTAWVIMCGS